MILRCYSASNTQIGSYQNFALAIPQAVRIRVSLSDTKIVIDHAPFRAPARSRFQITAVTIVVVEINASELKHKIHHTPNTCPSMYVRYKANARPAADAPKRTAGVSRRPRYTVANPANAAYPSIPINDHQTCLDCGATRLYLFHTDFEHADAGIFIGKWKKAVRPQSAHRVIAKTLIDNAIIPARRPLDGRAAVLNPGSESALFQPQPREKAVRA